MGALDTYDEALAELDRLITGRDQPRDFRAAYTLALKVAVCFPARPQVWAQLVLLANLTDNHDEALRWQELAPQACGSTWSTEHTTDCERDHALYCIRHRDFDAARSHLTKACDPGAEDPNRNIVLFMVDGRIHYAEGNYEAAIRRYGEAIRAWGQLGPDRINQQWRFNTHRWLLKALVAQHGNQNERAQATWHELQQRMERHGSSDLQLRLSLIMRYGQRGNQIDDFLESPRGQQSINRLGIERAVRYLLRRRRQR